MADITGPISTLSGAVHPLPSGTMCDFHPDRPAVKRIQGETDSFGSELNDCCAECCAEIAADIDAAKIGRCDWCKSDATTLKDQRDYEEGTRGPVYRVCEPCCARYSNSLRQEMDHRGDWDDYDYD